MATLAPAEEIVLSRVLPELVRLSSAARLEVIQQLVASMQTEAAATPRKTLLDFAGAWANMPGSAEEISAGIRNARTFTRPEISLD